MKSEGLSFILVFAVLIILTSLLVACGSSGPESSTPPTSLPTGSLPPPTTTLQAETGNNTSAADSFLRQTNGNLGAGNVSKLPMRSLLYTGSNTKTYVTWLGWFGRKDHMSVGYNSTDPAQVHRQVMDMMSRGVQGAIAAWYGAASTGIESATQLLKSEAEANVGQFEFAIMEDVGALGSAAVKNGCEVTDQLIADLTYVASQYESSPSYTRMNGRPVVFFFGVDTYYIDWSRVVSSIPGNPLLIFQGTSGLTREISDGGFSWVDINPANPFDYKLSTQDSFYTAAQQAPERLAFGAAYKGFNDTLAMWGTNRVANQHCANAWQQTFSEAGKFYSSSNQLPAIQVATWNDYEEGTAIEPGIDNCIFLAPSQSGTTIGWTVSGGDESTIDHYTVFVSADGTNLAKLGDVARGTHTFDLAPLNLPAVTSFVYVEAIGLPSVQNKMSPAIGYHPGDLPPQVVLNVSQTGALAFTASTAGSSGNITRSMIDFGDGTVVNEASSSHAYSTVGTYLITASVYDAAGASTVAVQQISVKPASNGVTISSPADGSTVNWPTMLVASANPATPASVMRVLIDGKQVYADSGDTLNTALKVFTGAHEISVQSLDNSGRVTGTAFVHVLAEPKDIPPVAHITLKALPDISPTTVLGCTVTSKDPDGFLIGSHLTYSDGSKFSGWAALESFSAAGKYSATVTVTDQFGATDSSSVRFTVDDGQVSDVRLETPAATPAVTPTMGTEPSKPAPVN